MSASARRAGHADAMVPDAPAPVRRALLPAWLARGRIRGRGRQVLAHGVGVTGTPRPARGAARAGGRERVRAASRLLRVFLPRGSGADAARLPCGHVHAAWGELAGRAAMAMIVGPEHSHSGSGRGRARHLRAVQLAPSRRAARRRRSSRSSSAAATPAARRRARRAAPRPGRVHARHGGGAAARPPARLCPRRRRLWRRLSGAGAHPATASSRSAVRRSPPWPRGCWRRSSGSAASAHDEQTPEDLSRHVPEIRIVESVVRLPRVLGEELQAAHEGAAAEERRVRLCLPA